MVSVDKCASHWRERSSSMQAQHTRRGLPKGIQRARRGALSLDPPTQAKAPMAIVGGPLAPARTGAWQPP
jgi:hypothetical protein